MRLLPILVALLLAAPSLAFAQVGPEPPDPKPDPSYGEERPELYKGFYLGGGFGPANPRGSFYGNRWKPGPAMYGVLGWKPIAQVALEGSFQGSVNDVRASGVSNGQITELAAGVRVFPLGNAWLQPTLALSYSPMAAADAGDVSFKGTSAAIASGVRLELKKPFWLAADVRYSWVRWVTVSDEALGISGRMARQEHGDVVSVLVLGGARF